MKKNQSTTTLNLVLAFAWSFSDFSKQLRFYYHPESYIYRSEIFNIASKSFRNIAKNTWIKADPCCTHENRIIPTSCVFFMTYGIHLVAQKQQPVFDFYENTMTMGLVASTAVVSQLALKILQMSVFCWRYPHLSWWFDLLCKRRNNF